MAARWLEFRTGKWAIISAVYICTLLFVNWGFELVRDADKLGA